LVRLGHSVHVLDDLSTGRIEALPAGAQFFRGDVSDKELLTAAIQGVDGCFHLAARVPSDPSAPDQGGHAVNLDGALAVFDAATRARSRPVPVVYASSCAVYGDNPDLPLEETSNTRPVSPYGADKLACEHHALVAWLQRGVPTCGLRIFDAYGPGQNPASAYASIIQAAGESARLGRRHRIAAPADVQRDFVFIDDVVRCLLLAMGRLRSGGVVYNVCTGRPTSLWAAARLVAETLALATDIEFLLPGGRRSGSVVGDPAEARATLGFEACTGLAEGIARTFGQTSQRKQARTAARDYLLGVPA
jgi:UDP-glucose 4-epimerase